jgi:hypothetical protein
MAQILLKWRGILASNLCCASEIGRLGDFFSDSMGRATQGSGRHHGWRHGWAQARAKVKEIRQGFFLDDLDYERNLFCPLTVVNRATKGGRWGGGSGGGWWWWGLPLAKLQLQEVVQHLPRGLLLLLGRFNSSNWWWIAQIWWRLGFSVFRVLRAKIRWTRATIYRGFCTES